MLNDTIGCSLQKDTQYDFFNNTRQEDAKGSPRGGGGTPSRGRASPGSKPGTLEATGSPGTEDLAGDT